MNKVFDRDELLKWETHTSRARLIKKPNTRRRTFLSGCFLLADISFTNFGICLSRERKTGRQVGDERQKLRLDLPWTAEDSLGDVGDVLVPQPHPDHVLLVQQRLLLRAVLRLVPHKSTKTPHFLCGILRTKSWRTKSSRPQSGCLTKNIRVWIDGAKDAG